MSKPCFIVFIVSLYWTSIVSAQSLHIRVLDVAEGQAILLHQNQRAVLIDTGHAGAAHTVLMRMRELNIKGLDYLFLTHLHPDHASGYFRIQEAFSEVKVRDNCYPVEEQFTPDMMRWVDQALKLNTNRKCMMAGDRIVWGGQCHQRFMAFAKASKGSRGESFFAGAGSAPSGNKLLIMGDADRQAEMKLLENKLLKPVDILIVGHHGAEDASSERFLKMIKPKKSVISINKENIRGYPSPGVIKRLQRNGSDVYTTYEHGELHFIFAD